MSLLARILSHDAGSTCCAVDPSASALLRAPDGSLPAWVALEHMAQCIAAHGGLLARARGKPPRVGVFVGTRRASFAVPTLSLDQELRVRAEPLRATGGLLRFACSLERASDGQRLAEARLDVFVPADPKALS
jgi:predicted hotdog family 3-hydroxylacyl-ACP dehydratase